MQRLLKTLLLASSFGMAMARLGAPSNASYFLNATNTKCAYRHPDRLFRRTGHDTESCHRECLDTPDCNYFSIAEEGRYTGVCMGCVQGVTHRHRQFKFYSMSDGESHPTPEQMCDELAYSERVDCGWWGVTQAQCESKGCCFRVDPVPNPNHIPYCYTSWTATPECDISHDEKTDCGYDGITPGECIANGCCYRQDPNPNPTHVPWCYDPKE